MAKLTDMSVTPAEQKERARKTQERMDGDTGPDYPYGLSVRLDESSLQKLKVKELPKAGEEIEIHGTAKVRAVRMESRDGGDADRSVELQITHLAPFAEDAGKTAEKVYDGAGARRVGGLSEPAAKG